MGAMASCAPPNTLLIAAPTPRPCPAPTPLSTAITQTELWMVDIAKLESKQGELKVENIRLKSNGHSRKFQAKKRKLNQAELMGVLKRFKKREYNRVYNREQKTRTSENDRRSM